MQGISLNKKKRPIKVCNFCRKRKIKCDKGDPCSSCVKFGNEKCEYGLEKIPGSSLLTKLTDKIMRLNQILGPEKSNKVMADLIEQLNEIEESPHKFILSIEGGSDLTAVVNHQETLNSDSFKNSIVNDADVNYSLEKLADNNNDSSSQYKNYSLGDFFDDANFGQFNDQFRQYQGPYTEEHDIYWDNLMDVVAPSDLDVPRMGNMQVDDIMVDQIEPVPSYANMNLLDLNKTSTGFSTDIMNSQSMVSESISLATPQAFDSQAASISLTNPLIGADSYLKLLSPKPKLDNVAVKLETETAPKTPVKRQKISKATDPEPAPHKKHYSLADYYTDANEGKFDDFHTVINIKYSLHMFDDRCLSHMFTKVLTPDIKLQIFNFESLTRFGNLEFFLQKYYESEKLPVNDRITETPSIPEGLGFSSLVSYLPTLFPRQDIVNELINLFFRYIYCFAPVLSEQEFKAKIGSIIVFDKTKPDMNPHLKAVSEDDIVIITTSLVVCKLCNDFCNDFPGDFISNLVIPAAEICLFHYNLLQCTNMYVMKLGCMVLFYYNLAGNEEKLKSVSSQLLAMAINMNLNESTQGIGNNIWFFLMEINLELYLNYNINNNIVNVSYTNPVPDSSFFYNKLASLNQISGQIFSMVPYLMTEFKKLKVLVTSLDIYDSNDQIYSKLEAIEEKVKYNFVPKNKFNQYQHILTANKFKWLLILEGAKLSVSYQIFNHFLSLHDLVQVKASLQKTIKITKGAIELIIGVKQFYLNNVQMSYVLTINMSNILDILLTIFLNFRLKFGYFEEIGQLIDRLLKNLLSTMDVIGLDLRLFRSWKLFNITNYIFNNILKLDSDHYTKTIDQLDDKVFLGQIRSQVDAINDL